MDFYAAVQVQTNCLFYQLKHEYRKSKENINQSFIFSDIKFLTAEEAYSNSHVNNLLSLYKPQTHWSQFMPSRHAIIQQLMSEKYFQYFPVAKLPSNKIKSTDLGRKT